MEGKLGREREGGGGDKDRSKKKNMQGMREKGRQRTNGKYDKKEN